VSSAVAGVPALAGASSVANIPTTCVFTSSGILLLSSSPDVPVVSCVAFCAAVGAAASFVLYFVIGLSIIGLRDPIIILLIIGTRQFFPCQSLNKYLRIYWKKVLSEVGTTGPMYFIFCRLYPFPRPSHHGSVGFYLPSLYSLLKLFLRCGLA
jgi:hypothetical protein